MHVLIVYGSQFGTTEKLARIMGSALEQRHTVQVVAAKEAKALTGDDVQLLLVGAPDQVGGRRDLAKPFLSGLRERVFVGIAAAAFDTRMKGAEAEKGTAGAIAEALEAAGCRLVLPPEGFMVAGFTGPLAPGEDERAMAWALKAAEFVASPV